MDSYELALRRIAASSKSWNERHAKYVALDAIGSRHPNMRETLEMLAYALGQAQDRAELDGLFDVLECLKTMEAILEEAFARRSAGASS